MSVWLVVARFAELGHDVICCDKDCTNLGASDTVAQRIAG